jgi:hypothetical protein
MSVKTDRTTTVEQAGIITAEDLLREVAAMQGQPGRALGPPPPRKPRDLRTGRVRVEVEIEEGHAYFSARDLAGTFTLTASPEDMRALGSMLLATAGLEDGRAGCYLGGSLEVSHA